jgi:hypothetical protein
MGLREDREASLDAMRKNFVGLKKALADDMIQLTLCIHKETGQVVAAMCLPCDPPIFLAQLLSSTDFRATHAPLEVEDFLTCEFVDLVKERLPARVIPLKPLKKGKPL